jgi:hypothetical protein
MPLGQTTSWKHFAIVIVLELLFVLFALIFVGHGIKQWKKKKAMFPHIITAGFGGVLLVLSFYAFILLLNIQ